jgi:chorismate mutase
MDFLKPDTVLDLQNIRDVLVRMEDTIIFNFIERSQFYACPSVYQSSKFPIEDFEHSLLDHTILNLEKLQSQLRRFEAPDEVPFFPDDILKPVLPPINYPKILASYSDEVNINDTIKEVYVNNMVPLISTREGDQPENLGSCVFCDIDNLQALSRRIHFGKFVAEAKFQNEKEKYVKLILAKDVVGIDEAITNSAVEAKILERLIEKGKAYGTDPTLKQENKITPEYLAKIYKEYVIPLTKKVEVDYLLRRLEDE